MYRLHYSVRFKKDLKKIKNHPNFPFAEFRYIVSTLMNEQTLDEKYRNHELYGEWNNCYECHIRPNLLLIYGIDKQNYTFYMLRIGSHSELF